MCQSFIKVAFTLLCLTIVSANFLQRVEFDQGRTNLRLLATADSSKESIAFNQSRVLNTAVQANLGTTYLSKIGLNSTAPTDMLLFLFTNATGFCTDCPEFAQYSCLNNNCNANTQQPLSLLSPLFPVRGGYPVTHNNLTLGTSWQLKTPAMLVNQTSRQRFEAGGTGKSAYYIQDKTYGFIGLGLSGDAVKNFQTGDYPIFSIQVNSTGKGQLIFGRDSTVYDQTKTPFVFTSDANWTLQTTSMTIVGLVQNISFKSFPSNLIFDLQFPGIGIPSVYFQSGFMTFFIWQYKITTNDSYGNTDYPYVFQGNLTDLPNLDFGMVGNMNLTLPPAAYTRKLANNTYAILFNSVNASLNSTSNQYVNYTVLGWPVLAQFYSVFELPKNSAPTITLYPLRPNTTNTTNTSSSANSTGPVIPGNTTSSSNTTVPGNTTSSSSSNTTTPNNTTYSSNTTRPVTGNTTTSQNGTGSVPRSGTGTNGVGFVVVVLLVAGIYCLCKKKANHQNHQDLGVELKSNMTSPH